jgi:hypothetical protein
MPSSDLAPIPSSQYIFTIPSLSLTDEEDSRFSKSKNLFIAYCAVEDGFETFAAHSLPNCTVIRHDYSPPPFDIAL